jgi:hypothetical protein
MHPTDPKNGSAAKTDTPPPAKIDSTDTTMRLLKIKTQALEMMERLTSTLNAFENIKQESW